VQHTPNGKQDVVRYLFNESKKAMKTNILVVFVTNLPAVPKMCCIIRQRAILHYEVVTGLAVHVSTEAADLLREGVW